MKILKKAEQKNFTINTWFYKSEELVTMLDNGIIDYIFNKYVIYTEDCREVKVVCFDGMYQTVAVTNDGLKIFITL